MPIQLILTQSVDNLGKAGDLVTVKPGFGRNYLIPKGIAVLATKSAVKDLVEMKRQAEHKQEFVKAQVTELAEKLADVKIVIETLAGEDGKLFGSVTTLQIANKLKEKGFEVDRKTITVDDIRNIGAYKAQIHLHKEVKAEVDIEVIRKDS